MTNKLHNTLLKMAALAVALTSVSCYHHHLPDRGPAPRATTRTVLVQPPRKPLRRVPPPPRHPEARPPQAPHRPAPRIAPQRPQRNFDARHPAPHHFDHHRGR